MQTTSNEAYEDMKQGRGGQTCEIMDDVTPTVTTCTKISPTSVADLDEAPFASSQPPPALPSSETKKEE